MEQWLVVGISGVTCGGKTTLATNLYNYFNDKCGHEIKTGVDLNRVEIIRQDDYFRLEDDPNHQKIEQLNHINWEIIESIDTDRMITDIMKILGKKFTIYNTRSTLTHMDNENLFANHYAANYSSLSYNNDLMKSDDDSAKFKHIKHNNVLNILIIEGFLILNHPVTLDLCNVKFHLHVPYEICYERRKSRVYQPPDVLGYFEMIVWPEYEKHLKSFKDREDVVFLNGEATPEKCFQYVLKSLLEEL